MNAYKYKNFINGDKILDLLKTQTFYKPDNELKGFDPDLLLENYIKSNKKIFCEKIFSQLSKDLIKIGPDAFVMKSRKLQKNFKNSKDYNGNNYSLFTIEYSSIKTLKSGMISQSHKYYNFKNWMYTKECRYQIDNSFVIGRKYTTCDTFNFLAENPYTFEDLLCEADEHFNTIKTKTIGVDIFPNMKNTSDFPYHHAKKLISEKYLELTAIKGISREKRNSLVQDGIFSSSQLDLKRSDKKFENFKKLPLPSGELLFIDFEILTNIYDDFSSFPRSNKKNHLFNVGIVTTNEEVSFVSKTLIDEKIMMKDFVDFLNKSQTDTITFVHWTNIEKRIFEEKMKEYSFLKVNKNIEWFDFHKYFVESDIYIEDCNNYKLKNVSRCLEEQGLIKSKWDNGLFFDGLGAMTGFIKYLKTRDETILDEIIKYNQVDCRVMLEIYDVVKHDLDIPNS